MEDFCILFEDRVPLVFRYGMARHGKAWRWVECRANILFRHSSSKIYHQLIRKVFRSSIIDIWIVISLCNCSDGEIGLKVMKS